MVKRRHAVTVGFMLAGLTLGTPLRLGAQLFQGPAQGTSATGEVVQTTSFGPALPSILDDERPVPFGRIDPIPAPPWILPGLSPIGANDQIDLGAWSRAIPGSRAPALLTDFQGVLQTTSIPPDPIMAAGPNHLMGLVNRRFAIFSKAGVNEKEIDAPSWFNGIEPGNNAFDPKVIYDHFAGRWVMVYLSLDVPSNTSRLLVSVSDDSDPHGFWCNWSLPGNQNGSVVTANWSDYQGVGFDEDAIYIVPNQFTFATFSFDYVKIRILPKATLYEDLCPAITWTDFWDLRDPNSLGQIVFTTRPAVTYGTPGVEYLVGNSVFVPYTYMTLWSLTNPLAPVPGLSAVNVPTGTYNPPPNADQLGGSTIPIDVGGGRVRNLVYRDGSVWTAHSVASPSGTYARAHYVRIDVGTQTATEDVAFGTDGCWNYYPAITADENSNMAMVYNQSCTDSYIGIRYTGRTPSDPGLQPSAELKAGETNYVKDFGSGSNRWGDYSGISVDPANPQTVWMFAEYAASPANTWSTWFGQVAPRRLGDINNDGSVDIGDIVLLVDFILEFDVPDPLEAFSADCNQDAIIDIGDLVCVVNIILGGGGPVLAAAPPASASGGGIARARLSQAAAQGSGEGRTILLETELPPGVAALQARISYDPSRVRLDQPELTSRAEGFKLVAHDKGDELVLVIYNLEGETLKPGAGPILKLPIRTVGFGASPKGGIGVDLSELLLADRTGAVRPAAIAQSSLTALPVEFRLSQPYPNPVDAASGTRFDLEIPEGVGPAFSGPGGGGAGAGRGGSVRVVAEVFNVRGQRIRLVMDEELIAGQHSIEWDGRSDRGAAVGAGLYVLRLRAGSFTATRKLIVVSR